MDRMCLLAKAMRPGFSFTLRRLGQGFTVCRGMPASGHRGQKQGQQFGTYLLETSQHYL